MNYINDKMLANLVKTEMHPVEFSPTNEEKENGWKLYKWEENRLQVLFPNE